jgi:hypothetical protein
VAEPGERAARSVSASELVADATSEDDLARVVDSFTASGIGDENFRELAAVFEASIAKREEDRTARSSTRSTAS